MKHAFRFIFCFLFVNLAVLLPIVTILSSFAPDRLFVEVESPTDVILRVCDIKNGNVIAAASCSGGCLGSMRVDLPTWTKWNDIELKYDNNNQSIKVRSVYLCHRLLFSETPDGRMVFKPERRIGLGLVFVEFLGLLMAIMGLFNRKTMAWKEYCVRAIPAILLFSTYYAFVIPAQSYLSNASSFDYSIQEVLASSVVRFAVLLVWGLVICVVSKSLYGYFIPVMLFAFVLYGYLETGIMTIGAPTLNGDMLFYSNNIRIVIDLVVQSFMVFVLLVFSYIVGKNLHWATLALGTMVLASLFDVKKDDVIHDDKANAVCATCDSQKLMDSIGYSSRRNAIVFVLDTISTEDALAVLGEAPTLKDTFSGFIAFTNNVGMHSYTLLAAPGISTGIYYDDTPENSLQSERIYSQSAYGKDSVIGFCADQGIPAFAIYGSDPDHGHATRLKDTVWANEDSNLARLSVFDRRIKDSMAWNLDEISAFRLVPVGIKPMMLTLFSAGWGMGMGIRLSNEYVLYKYLAEAEIHSDWACCFHTYHTDGAHYPYLTDRHGVPKQIFSSVAEARMEKGILAFSSLAKLLDALKQRGLYDNSFIVVTADHGENGLNSKTDLYPFLWIKPRNSRGAMSFSNVPSSLAKIALLMKKAVCEDLSEQEISATLFTSKRLFRRIGVGIPGKRKIIVLDENGKEL